MTNLQIILAATVQVALNFSPLVIVMAIAALADRSGGAR